MKKPEDRRLIRLSEICLALPEATPATTVNTPAS